MDCYITHLEPNSLSFFAALYCSCLGFNALLALTTKEGDNNMDTIKYRQNTDILMIHIPLSSQWP